MTGSPCLSTNLFGLLDSSPFHKCDMDPNVFWCLSQEKRKKRKKEKDEKDHKAEKKAKKLEKEAGVPRRSSH